MNNKSSLCYLTYGQGGNYTYFIAYPDRKKQNSRNAAANVAGALSFVFLGVGVFSVGGAESWDEFISSEEILINNRRKNNKLLDSNFMRIPSNAILSIGFQTDKKYQSVLLTLAGGDSLLLDMSLKTYSAEFVRESFLKLKENNVVVQETEKQAAQQAPSEDVFGI